MDQYVTFRKKCSGNNNYFCKLMLVYDRTASFMLKMKLFLSHKVIDVA